MQLLLTIDEAGVTIEKVLLPITVQTIDPEVTDPSSVLPAVAVELVTQTVVMGDIVREIRRAMNEVRQG